MEETRWVMGPGDGDSDPPLPRLGFDALYHRYEGRVMATVRELVDSPAEAEQVAQEAWLAIHHALAGGGEPARLTPWVERVARNTARRHLRRRAALREVPLGAMPLWRRADPRPWANLEAHLEIVPAA